MTTRRIVTLIIAAVVAFLIIYAGKSCAEDIAETNRKNSANKTIIQNSNVDTPSLIENQPAGNQQNTPTDPATDSETPTEYVETVTNIFGEVIGTVPPTQPQTDAANQTPSGDAAEITDDNTQQEPATPPPILDRTPAEEKATEAPTVDLNEIVIRIE